MLTKPLLYLSLFLKQNRAEYYERLSGIRTRGDWEGWLTFFLTGVTATATDAVRVAAAVSEMRDRHVRLAASENLGRYGVPLLDLLAEQPLVTVKYALERIGATPTTTGGLLDKMASLGIVEEVTGQKRNRVYRYSPFLDLFTHDEPSDLALSEEVTS